MTTARETLVTYHEKRDNEKGDSPSSDNQFMDASLVPSSGKSSRDDVGEPSRQKEGVVVAPPNDVVHHTDYRLQAQHRKAELEALRQRHLAKPQAARLTGAAAPLTISSFASRQTTWLKQQKRLQQQARELLHQYRANPTNSHLSRGDGHSRQHCKSGSLERDSSSDLAYLTFGELYQLWRDQDNSSPLARNFEESDRPNNTTPCKKSDLSSSPRFEDWRSSIQAKVFEACQVPLPVRDGEEASASAHDETFEIHIVEDHFRPVASNGVIRAEADAVKVVPRSSTKPNVRSTSGGGTVRPNEPAPTPASNQDRRDKGFFFHISSMFFASRHTYSQ